MENTERFTDRVDFYNAGRPSYPAALLRFFQSQLGLSPDKKVADVGSGTGLLTELFVRNGNPTFAVEPNAAMRHSAEQRLGQWPNFTSVDATAEATTLGDASVDLITAGQAFHWFEPNPTRAEFQRILRPGGHVALVWNERVVDRSPFTRAYQQFLDTHRVDRSAVRSGDITGVESDVLAKFFGPSGHHVHSFSNPQRLDKRDFLDRIRSSSYMPLPPHADYDRIMRAAEQLFDTHQSHGAVQVEHDTRVYFGAFE